jgi:hypothetical protein
MSFLKDQDKNAKSPVIRTSDDETPPTILGYYREDRQFIKKPKNITSGEEVLDGFVDDEDVDVCEPYSCPPHTTYVSDDQEQESQIFFPGGSEDSGHSGMVTEATTNCKSTVYPSLSQLFHDRGTVEVSFANVGDPHKVISPGQVCKRGCCLYEAFSLLLFTIIVMASIVGIKVMGEKSFPLSDNHSPTTTPIPYDDISLFPTLIPTSEIDYLYFQEFSQALGHEEWKFSVNSPQSRALKWIMEEDERHLNYTDNGLTQRFILALFYFITTSNGQSPWRSCNPDFTDSSNKICNFEAFSKKKKKELAYIPKSSFRWLSSVHECKWAGNVCNDRNIIRFMDLGKCSSCGMTFVNNVISFLT